MQVQVVLTEGHGSPVVVADAGTFTAPCLVEGGLLQCGPSLFVNPNRVLSVMYAETTGLGSGQTNAV